MNIRFYHAKILLTKADHTFEVAEGELWVRGDHICYIGDGTDTSDVCKLSGTGRSMQREIF